jgi:ribosomal protein L37AE/L43A
MPKALRTGAVLAGVAFLAGWAYRQAFPKTACPKCGNRKWKRIGGGLKACQTCGHKFFAQLPESKQPVDRQPGDSRS